VSSSRALRLRSIYDRVAGPASELTYRWAVGVNIAILKLRGRGVWLVAKRCRRRSDCRAMFALYLVRAHRPQQKVKLLAAYSSLNRAQREAEGLVRTGQFSIDPISLKDQPSHISFCSPTGLAQGLDSYGINLSFSRQAVLEANDLLAVSKVKRLIGQHYAERRS